MVEPNGKRRHRASSAKAVTRLSVLQRLRSYFLRHAQNFFGALGGILKAPVGNLMTVAVIGIALALPAGLHVLVANGKALSGRWDSAVDVSVYLRDDVDIGAARKLARKIEAREDVATVDVISAESALEEFRQLSGFGPALDALAENPLPVVLVVSPDQEHRNTAAIVSLGVALDALGETDIVQMDTEWVNRFHAILDIIRRAVLLAATVLALGVVIIVGNTIRLDIQNRRDEIEVTKLVGASDAFIRRPFLYSGLWYGLLGGVFAVALVMAGLWLLSEPVGRVAGLYGSQFRLIGLTVAETAGVAASGALLGWLGSWLAASRHMRRIEPT